MKTKTVTEFKIEPYKNDKPNPENIVAYDLFSEPYTNCIILASKNSGKSTLLGRLIPRLVGRQTIVLVFCSTIKRGSTWKLIKKDFVHNHINCLMYDDYEDEMGTNIAMSYVTDMLKDEDEEEAPKKRKPKKIYPKLIFIFDDFGAKMREKWVSQLFKVNRHMESKVFVIVHSLSDVEPSTLKNTDVVMTFNGLTSLEKQLHFYNLCEIKLPFEAFCRVYKDATREKYSMLYVDTNNDKLRKNFTEEYVIEEEEYADE